jgi:hypothetical protein
MKYNIGTSNSYKGLNRNNFFLLPKPQIGRVYGVVTTENTPSEKQFKRAGGFNGIGSIFYLDYDGAKNITGAGDDFWDQCKIAKPLSPQFQYYPILGELVTIQDLPSSDSQISLDSASSQKYYSNVINIWNNQQQNSQPGDPSDLLGITFRENSLIRNLIPFEGDNILQGRQGSALRFSTTSRPTTTSNEWSKTGNEDDPITILTNGLKFERNKQFYVERINKDDSSLYLTSTQTIPLDTDKKGILNNWTNPKNVSDYINSQAILNADRVILNSKKDEVMIFAETNVEINTKNVINLNADTRVHLNTDSVFLGRYDPNALPQPLLLGRETIVLFTHFIKTLNKLAKSFSEAISTPQGSPIINLNTAGTELFANLSTAADLLKKIPSTKIFIAPDNAIQTNNQIPTSTNEEFQIIQTSYRSPIEETVEQTVEETETPPTPPNVELKEEKVCPINFQSTFGSGDPDFKDDPNTVNLLRQKVQELVTCIKQNQNNANVKSIRIEVQGGESQVPNQEEYEIVGSLANARRDNLINYLRKSLQSYLNIIPNITSLDYVLGTTPWTSQRFLDKAETKPNPKFIPKDDQRFTDEQFVTVTVIVTKEVTTSTTTTTTTAPPLPQICKFAIDAKQGLVGSKNNNFITYENIFDVKNIPNGNKIKITFGPRQVPDLMIVEAGNKVYNTGWIGGDITFSSLLATVLGNAYNGRPPLPFPQDIEPWAVEEAIEYWKYIDEKGSNDYDKLKDNMSYVLTNVNWNRSVVNQIKQITWYNFKTNPIKKNTIPREKDEIKDKNGNDLRGFFGDTITIIKDSSFESVKIKIYSPLGTTVWDLVGRCE